MLDPTLDDPPIATASALATAPPTDPEVALDPATGRPAGRAQALGQICREAEHGGARVAAFRDRRRSRVIGAAAKAHHVAADADDAGHDADIDSFGDKARALLDIAGWPEQDIFAHDG